MTVKWGACLGLKEYGNPGGVTCWGRVQRDSKVGGNWNCYSKAIKGVSSWGRIQSHIKVGGMIGINSITVV